MTAPADRPQVTVPVPPGNVMTDPDRLRWGTVSTIRAPLRDIARFAAWHLDLGAAEINVFLDESAPETVAFLAPHPAIRITVCDDAYWRNKPEKARRTHQLRQAFNATSCYRDSSADWLAHIDVDEFLLSPHPLAGLLAGVAADTAFVSVAPAEMLAQPDPWNGPVHFKLTRREVGHPRAVLEDIYPEFGAHVPEGFLSYTGAKNIARTGLPDIRFGVHAVLHKGRPVANGTALASAHVGHAHAPSWEVFQRHMAFRLTKGSYRKKNPETVELKDVLDLLVAEEGPAGLHRFFTTVNTAGPDLLDRLATHDMLLVARLDLDERVARRFGNLPDGESGA